MSRFQTAVPEVVIYGRPNFERVFARRALLPMIPGFFSAVARLLAGIFSPALTPRDERKAPGFLIASLIQFLAISLYFLHGVDTGKQPNFFIA